MAPNFAGTDSVERVEAPVTFKAYLMCGFASFGGIYFGYDIGYINSVFAMRYFIHEFANKPYPPETPESDFVLPTSDVSLITSILSAGTFFGAIIAGDLADWIGRRMTILVGCGIFCGGVIMSVASTNVALLSAGRFICGIGVGFESAIVILYMSECAPRKVRGAIVAVYQFCITIGLLLAACVGYATQNRTDSGSYRIPIAIQWIWALVLAGGIAWLPESPRYFVKKGKIERATKSLASLRGQPPDSDFVREELAEIIANHEYELQVVPQDSYLASWANCFQGSIWKSESNLRRTILGTSLQMMQQWTGVNFIFYFGTRYFTQLGTIDDPFLISLITTLVNVLSTPISFWTIERFGRRPLLIYGGMGMLVCQFIAASVGTALPASNQDATRAQIAFVCIAIFFFASTWGPTAWVVIGETFPLPIRSRGVGLSTASNWFWNCILAVISPYFVGEEYANMGPAVFFVWGGLCTCATVYAYFLVPETKGKRNPFLFLHPNTQSFTVSLTVVIGLTLEQVDTMLEETNPRNSAKWRPHTTFAAQMGMTTEGKLGTERVEEVDVERRASS
ncbi:hypothetical protein MBLNU230_g8452t1 [Neophaeotheca triangularis]